MKGSRTARSTGPENELYRDFMRLDRERRRRIAVRILRNQRLLADLHDHFLIQDSLAEPGESVSWESHVRGDAAGR